MTPAEKRAAGCRPAAGVPPGTDGLRKLSLIRPIDGATGGNLCPDAHDRVPMLWAESNTGRRTGAGKHPRSAFTVATEDSVQFEVVFVPEHNVLRVRAEGEGGPDAAQEMVTAIRSAPDFHPGIGVLIDAISTDYTPSTSDATSFPALFGAQLPGSRLALMVRRGPQYNVGCVVEALATESDVPFAVFRDRFDAMQWLRGSREGVDPAL